jgi:hypothetical protein
LISFFRISRKEESKDMTIWIGFIKLNEGELSLASLEQATHSETLAWLKDLLGERVDQISPQAMAFEARVWDAIGGFQWPSELPSHMKQVAASLIYQPELIDHASTFYDRLLRLAALSEDAPEIVQLVEECLRDPHLQAFLHTMTTFAMQVPALESPYSDALRDMLISQLSPAQFRFFAEIERRRVVQADDMENADIHKEIISETID